MSKKIFIKGMLVFSAILTLTSGFIPNLAIMATAQTITLLENAEDGYNENVLKNNHGNEPRVDIEDKFKIEDNQEFVYIDLASHDFSDMHLAIPQQQERIVKTTTLVAIKGSKLFRLRFGATTIAPLAKNVSINFVNNSTNFVNARTTIGGRTINFNRPQMIHVLQRHHQNFWAGVQNGGVAGGQGPGLFARSATPNSIRDVAFHVLRQHQGRIQSGVRTGNFDARVGNHTFRVRLDNGQVTTVFPLR